MQPTQLIPHLFRTEASRITAVLCRLFGIEHVQVAEDIVGETFLTALETWPYKGIPENPTAWLYAVAKNKTKTWLNRNQVFREKVEPTLSGAEAGAEQIDLSEENIADSQLQMLFAICTPVIPVEAQVGLALRILCGFGIEEIANAFLTTKETINKRLYRAKEKLRAEKVEIKFPSKHEIVARIDAVLITIYLLFNEGYYSESQDTILQKDLCLEAVRLTYLLIANPSTNTPPVNALMALMCFHSSRFEARKSCNGEHVLYDDQDERLWNHELITRGAYYLRQAAVGKSLSKYHLEAGIAYWHTVKGDDKKWENILDLYNQLLAQEYSPIAALNRTYAVAKVRGYEVAIAEAKKLNLYNSQFYHLLLGELYSKVDKNEAYKYYSQALAIVRSETVKNLVNKKIAVLQQIVKTD